MREHQRKADADFAFVKYRKSDEYQDMRDRQLRSFFDDVEARSDCGSEIDIKIYRTMFLDPHRRPEWAFDGNGQPAAPYVQVILKNTCRDFYKREKRRWSREQSADASEEELADTYQPSETSDFEHLVIEYSNLDNGYANDLRLMSYKAQGYTNLEIARMLELDVFGNTDPNVLADRVRKRVRAAADRVQQRLQ